MDEPVKSDGDAFVVQAEESGRRLDRVVSARLGIARTRAAELCARGLVRVNGRRGAKGAVVAAGDKVEVRAIDAAAVDFAPRPNPAVDVRVLYVDEAMIAVCKAAGMATHPLRSNEDDTLANGLVARFPEVATIAPHREAGIAHRLDRWTSGVVIAGRKAAAYAALRESFARHEVEKEYVALVLGRVAEAGGVTSALQTRGRARVAREEDDGLPAETRFWPIEVFESGLTLVRIETSTGRRHQVRVHLASVGHPLAGDAAYQNADERAGDRSGLKEPFLHASRIVVPHPVTGARVDVASELPADRQAVLGRLRGAG